MPAIVQIAESKGVRVPDELRAMVSRRAEELRVAIPAVAPAPTAPRPATLRP
jgi:hypothetical protein